MLHSTNVNVYQNAYERKWKYENKSEIKFFQVKVDVMTWQFSFQVEAKCPSYLETEALFVRVN